MLTMSPSFVYQNGEMFEVPDITLSDDTTLTEKVTRTLIITNGATVTALAPISSTVRVESGVLDARSKVSGTVTVGAAGQASFAARMTGTLQVQAGGSAHIRATASALGTMHIDGYLLNEGERGAQRSGTGEVDDRGSVRPPDERGANGAVIYRD